MDCFRDTAFCTLEFKCSSFLNLLLFKIIGDVQMTGQDLLWGKLRLKYPYNQCLMPSNNINLLPFSQSLLLLYYCAFRWC